MAHDNGGVARIRIITARAIVKLNKAMMLMMKLTGYRLILAGLQYLPGPATFSAGHVDVLQKDLQSLRHLCTSILSFKAFMGGALQIFRYYLSVLLRKPR